ncbi:MAG: helix-turn-helix domain-containing protein [Janthinobacterium lividum]
MHIAKNLRYLRRRAGLSQAVLAQRVSLSINGLSRYEQGHATPGVEALERLARALGATPDELRYVDLLHACRYQKASAAAAQNAAPAPPGEAAPPECAGQ